MKTNVSRFTGLLTCCAIMAWGAMASAADVQPVGNIQVATTFQASKLAGLNVRNAAGEKLGAVDDTVIDVGTGRVAYVAMSVGGVLGIGEKLFAVPFTELRFVHGKNEMYFVLNMSAEKLKAAPGFDKSNWPDFADPSFTQRIDNYYRDARERDARETGAR